MMNFEMCYVKNFYSDCILSDFCNGVVYFNGIDIIVYFYKMLWFNRGRLKYEKL